MMITYLLGIVLTYIANLQLIETTGNFQELLVVEDTMVLIKSRSHWEKFVSLEAIVRRIAFTNQTRKITPKESSR